MPYSRGCDEFSERLQTVLLTPGDPELNAVYNANADIWHVPRELVMVRSVHRDGHCHEAVKWYVHLEKEVLDALTQWSVSCD